MPKTYVTFGQSHTHTVNGNTLDKNCIAIIECVNEEDGRAKALEFFDSKFCMEYYETRFNINDLDYYPRGLIKVN